MFKNNSLSKAVRLAIVYSAATASAITSTAAFSADEEEAVERIEVTGSRIKRTDMEGATPVQVIDAQAIKDSGKLSIADLLHDSTFNTFGSFVESSGSSAQSNATVDLRGIGSQRTLVVVDGKRMPGSPQFGAASANLNLIPMAMVERIEVLTEGASATYGSDAIAGVINIITKKDYEGITFNVGAGRPSEEGGEEDYWNVVAGVGNDKGNLTIAVEQQKRGEIYDKDRPYSAARMEDLNGDGVITIYSETEGISYYGATMEDPTTGILSASPECDNLTANVDGFVGELASPWSETGTVCGYAYGDISTNRASTNRTSLVLNGNYELADDLIAFMRASVVRNESFGRYAPPAAPWSTVPADNANNPYGEEATGYFRWYQLGPRKNNITDTNRDALVSIEYGVTDSIVIDAFAHYSYIDTFDIGNTYLSYAGLDYNTNNNIALDSEAGIANMSATTTTLAENKFFEVGGGVSFSELFELGGGDAAAYLGFNYHKLRYENLADAQSAAGLVGGGSGGDSEGDRQARAVFAEMVMPFTDDLEVNIAARYDDYSDAGSKMSPKISARYQATDELVLRASYAKGFRAPDMEELYGLETYSAAFAIDYVNCEAQGTDAVNCVEAQYDTYISSNENLNPETSTTYNFGVAWDATEWMDVSLDYYNIEVKDVISYVGPQSLILREQAGLASPDNATLYRSDNGRIDRVEATYDNLSELSTDGFDLSINTRFETENMGDFEAGISTSYVLSYEEPIFIGGPMADIAGNAGTPDYKAQFDLTWSNDDFRVAYIANYTPSTKEDSSIGTKDNGDIYLATSGELDSWLTHDVSVAYFSPYGTFKLGARNLTNEEPVLDSAGKWTQDELYNNLGRVVTLDYSVSF